MVSKTRPFDAANYLADPLMQAMYLSVAMEEGDAGDVAGALGVVARARGMSSVARETGLGRESLYKSLSEHGNPELATLLKVVRSLGLKLVAQPA